MLTLPKFVGIEKAEGWSKGEPEVLATTHVAGELGMPITDHPQLAEYFQGVLGVPANRRTAILCYGRSEEIRFTGFYIPGTPLILANPLAAEHHYATTGGVMRTIAHEGRHRADWATKLLPCTSEMVNRWALPFFVDQAVAATSVPNSVAAGLAAATMLRVGLWYTKYDPQEYRAMQQELDPTTMQYSQAILFPDTARAVALDETGQLPAEVHARMEAWFAEQELQTIRDDSVGS